MFNLIKLEWKKSSSFRWVSIILVMFITLGVLGEDILKTTTFVSMLIILIMVLYGLVFLGVVVNMKDDLDNKAPLNFILPFTGSQILFSKILTLAMNLVLIFIVTVISVNIVNGSFLDNSFLINLTNLNVNELSDSLIEIVSLAIAFCFYTTSLYTSMLFIKARFKHTSIFHWLGLWLVIVFLSSLLLVNLNNLFPHVFSIKEGFHRLAVKDPYNGTFLIDGLYTSRFIQLPTESSWFKELYLVSSLVFTFLSGIFFKISAYLIDRKLDL